LLYIQDPSFINTLSTHEAIISSCQSSVKGYGAYAFASPDGVKILFQDKEFDDLLDRGTYSLIVGIDEITNLKCLDALSQLTDSKPGLSVQAYFHNDKDSIFHPKISFFQEEEGSGSLIVGSGNLTLRGLRQNREAFGLIHLSSEEFSRMEEYWQAWIDSSRENLKSIDDDAVIAKARTNVFRRPPPSEIIIPNRNEEEPGSATPDQPQNLAIYEGWTYKDSNRALVAEIPRSGDRWKQANFDINTFQNFFGATPGDNSQRVLLRNINSDNSLSDIEIRPSVSVSSQNYRFELDAASGLPYPDNGKPIGIFVQVTTRMFLYHLFMPGQPLYDEISEWANTNWSGRADRMKRIVTSVENLNEILTKSAFKPYKV